MAHKIILFDTSIFIDHLRTNKFSYLFQGVQGLIRNTAVVLSELARGASKEEEKEFISELAKNHPVLIPTEKNWFEAGFILSDIYRDKGFLPDKLMDLHFDVLIVLTARNYGATVITSNKADFELIQKYKKFYLEVW